MKTYDEILAEEIKRTEKYSKSDFSKSIKALKIVRIFLSRGFYFCLSLIPFLAGIAFSGYTLGVGIIFLATHYIFYKKSKYKDKIAESKQEIDATIEVLEALKAEKFDK